MPRRARTRSESGYAHLIVRGIGKQVLFESREDYLFFLNRLERYSGEAEIGVCAYCLMENHVHLLIYDKRDRVASFMKRLGVSYSQYYNRRYERQGHLFQDRYQSEAIDDESYLLTVFRYILNNPKKAGICPASEYEWSSYGLYGYMANVPGMDLLFERIGDERQYASFIAEDNDDRCMEYDAAPRDDEWARGILKKHLKLQSGTALQAWDKPKRNAALQELLERGLSIRQIERLTGISRGIVQKAKR